jgi:hypothetical protein
LKNPRIETVSGRKKQWRILNPEKVVSKVSSCVVFKVIKGVSAAKPVGPREYCKSNECVGASCVEVKWTK